MLFKVKLYKIIFLNYSALIFVTSLIFQRLQEFSEIAPRVVKSERHPSGNSILVQISDGVLQLYHQQIT